MDISAISTAKVVWRIHFYKGKRMYVTIIVTYSIAAAPAIFHL